MSEQFGIGTLVQIAEGQGRVVSRFESNATQTIDGETISIEASVAMPAYLIEMEDESILLKSHEEVRRV